MTDTTAARPERRLPVWAEGLVGQMDPIMKGIGAWWQFMLPIIWPVFLRPMARIDHGP